jgi:predicted HicB family RNase H-like nuclease
LIAATGVGPFDKFAILIASYQQMKPKLGKEKERPMLKATLVRLPEDLLRRAKIAAIQRGTSLQQMVTDALGAHLTKEVKR